MYNHSPTLADCCSNFCGSTGDGSTVLALQQICWPQAPKNQHQSVGGEDLIEGIPRSLWSLQLHQTAKIMSQSSKELLLISALFTECSQVSMLTK